MPTGEERFFATTFGIGIMPSSTERISPSPLPVAPLLAALGGCVSADKTGPQQAGFGSVSRAREATGYQGPWGEPVPVTTGSKSPSRIIGLRTTRTAFMKIRGSVFGSETR